MEIKTRKFRINSTNIMNVLFIISLLTTLSQIAVNIFYVKRFSTETIVLSAFITILCYFFANKRN